MSRVFLAVLLLGVGCATPRWHTVRRVSPAFTRESVKAGHALLVCAYEKKKCEGTHLEGAISLEELEPRLAMLPKDQELILFCG